LNKINTMWLFRMQIAGSGIIFIQLVRFLRILKNIFIYDMILLAGPNGFHLNVFFL
jgi:hypothetical protein